MKRRKNALLLIALVLLISVHSFAQSRQKKRILFVLDCSGSMWGPMGPSATRMDVAKSLLLQMVDSLSKIPDLELALRAYGNRAKRGGAPDCKDSHLEVGFYPGNINEIKKKVRQLKPNGTTPIAYSLGECRTDFPDNKARNNIILITDGYEECGGNPCEISAELQSKGIILKPFIIGLGMTDSLMQKFTCIGRSFSANTAKDFSKILGHVVSEVVNLTTVTIHLNDAEKKPAEKDVSLTFYNTATKDIVSDLYQTINPQSMMPDTFLLNPTARYDMVVNTVPSITKRNIEIKPGQHNIISMDAAQGKHNISIKLWDKYQNVQCLVRKAGERETIFVQDANSTQKYLVGVYDLEFLTLPRIKMKNIKVDAGKENITTIPQAGRLDIVYQKEVFATVLALTDKGEEWVINLKGGAQNKTEDYIYIQPGLYKIIYRYQNAKSILETTEKDVLITSGKAVQVVLK